VDELRRLLRDGEHAGRMAQRARAQGAANDLGASTARFMRAVWPDDAALTENDTHAIE
jgi:hypothetical protein